MPSKPLGGGIKRTGYAAAAAGESVGAANGGTYRNAAMSANLAAAMSSLNMGGSGGSVPGQQGDAAGSSSSGEGLYTRPTVVLPQQQQAAAAGGRAFSSPLPGGSKRLADAPVALESPGFDDFAHMGLISDLLE
jgi:hypothetical protein